MDDGCDKGSDGKWWYGDIVVVGVLVNVVILEEGELVVGVNVFKVENLMNIWLFCL